MKTEIYTSPVCEVINFAPVSVLCTSGYAGDSEDVELF